MTAKAKHPTIQIDLVRRASPIHATWARRVKWENWRHCSCRCWSITNVTLGAKHFLLRMIRLLRMLKIKAYSYVEAEVDDNVELSSSKEMQENILSNTHDCRCHEQRIGQSIRMSWIELSNLDYIANLRVLCSFLESSTICVLGRRNNVRGCIAVGCIGIAWIYSALSIVLVEKYDAFLGRIV